MTAVQSFTPLPAEPELFVIAKDGDSWGAYRNGFTNLAASRTGWGATPQEALAALLAQPEGDKPQLARAIEPDADRS